MFKKNIKKGIFFLFLLCMSTTSAKAIYNDTKVGSYEEELSKFPCDYQEKIKSLHEIYPNAIFVAQKEFFDWNQYKEIPVKWDAMFKAQVGARSLISSTAQASYKTTVCAQKNSNNVCSWYQASNDAITYYMNPYNFLNEINVFMFESLYSKSYHTKEGVEKILAGSFMANKVCPGSEKTYAEVLLEAGEKNNVSPYMLASRLIQEQGRKGTSSLISGTYDKAPGENKEAYKGYYNYFNIQASGKTDEEVIVSGLQCAKGEKESCKGNNWTSPYISIVEGSKFVYKKYVGVNDTYNVKGQMSLYLQKWDPYGPQLGGHQYMQNIVAPVSESTTTYKSYASFADYKSYAYVFYIPIYEGAPNTTNTSCKTEMPQEEIKITGYKINGSYISGISVGTTQDAMMNSLKSSNEGLNVTIEKNANNTSSVLGTGDTIVLEKGNQKVTYQVVIYGDINGDGNINSGDLLKLRQHLIGTIQLSGLYLEAANTTRDSAINSGDLLKLRQHLIGVSEISQ